MSDLCTSAAATDGARERILAWLANGTREISWALCSFPREHWADAPPTGRRSWPALRHARHLALRETYVTLPAVRQVLGDAADELPALAVLERAEAAWDAAAAIQTAEAIVRGLGETRFELLQRLEAAPDAAWQRPLPCAVAADTSGAPIQLDWLMLHARQHELEHLSDIWRVALYWHQASPAGGSGRSPEYTAAGLARHPADRLEESH